MPSLSLIRSVPKNCRFEIGNAEDGFTQYTNGLNFIHLRCLNFGIKDWDSLIQRTYNALRPGGIVIALGSHGIKLFDEYNEEILVKEEGEEV
jgi:hypothetical protein